MSYAPPCTGINSIADNINTIKIGDFGKLPGGEARIQMLINLMMYLDFKSVIYFLETSIFKNINNDAINAFISKVRYKSLIKNYKNKFPDDLPFFSACKIGILENVKLLVNNHPSRRDVNGNDNNNMTLKEYVNQTNKSGETPLMIAVKFQHIHIVQYLIDQCEADTNITNNDGWNVLRYSVMGKYIGEIGEPIPFEARFKYYTFNFDLIQYLLEHMSIDSINRKCRSDKTPLDCTYLNPYLDNKTRLDVIELINSKGGKLNYRINGKLLDDDSNKNMRSL